MGGSKRKRSGPDNLYQRGDVWYGRTTVGGVERRESLKTRDRREAERRLEAWLKGLSPYHGTIRHTFLEAAGLWFKAGQWKPKTEAGYLALLNVLERHFGEAFWDQVDKAALQVFAAVRRDAGSGTATINRYLSVISGIADHVRELPGWPEVNPVKLLPSKPRRERRHPYIRPPHGDIEAIFARTRRPFQDFCRLALLCGARLDELAQLKRVDAAGGRASFWDTKNRTVRTIGWTEEARGIVERQPVTASPYLFSTRDGEVYSSVTGQWREARVRAQKAAQGQGLSITELRFHDLRHEYAIRYLENGGSVFTLQQLLGHGSIRQTEGYLRYLTPEQAARAKQGSAQNAAH